LEADVFNMSLGKQILALISLIYVMVFLGTLTIAVHNTRAFLNTQLASHAQDTATSLGLSLSLHIADDDPLMMESMIDAIFDRGYYRSIVLEDADGKPSIERQTVVKVYDVPTWFVEMLPLQTPTATAPVMAGWTNGGNIIVSAHPGFAYTELWTTTKQTLQWYALTLLVALLFSFGFIRLLLRPLRDVEQQAMGISNRDFSFVSPVPRTRELRRVVEAMNLASTKVAQMLEEHVLRADALRREAYLDVTTGLGNKAALDRAVDAATADEDSISMATLMLIQLDGLAEINAGEGYAAGDKVLQQAANRLRHHFSDNANELCRIGGSMFGVMAHSTSTAQLPNLLDELVQDFQNLRANDSVTFKTFAGASAHSGEGDASQLFERAEYCLRQAKSDPRGWCIWESNEEQQTTEQTQEDHWREILNEVVAERRVVIHFQPVYSCPDRALVHLEGLARCELRSGTLLSAGKFFPMVALLGLNPSFERAVVEELISQALAAKQDALTYVINVSELALSDPQFFTWLPGQIGASRLNIAVEVAETTALRIGDRVARLANSLREAGGRLGIDHCGGRDDGLSYLQYIRPAYVKIDGSFTHSLARDTVQREYVRALVATCHGLDCQVIAEQIETDEDWRLVCEIGFDAGQGHFLGRPKAGLPEHLPAPTNH